MLAKTSIAGNDVWLLEPLTYMNRSGQSVGALARFYKILPDEILVVHDELDLPPGAAKLKRGGSSGGHNGLKDITSASAPRITGACAWASATRARLNLQQNVADFVLHRPRREEQSLIEEAIDKALRIVPHGLRRQDERGDDAVAHRLSAANRTT